MSNTLNKGINDLIKKYISNHSEFGIERDSGLEFFLEEYTEELLINYFEVSGFKE